LAQQKQIDAQTAAAQAVINQNQQTLINLQASGHASAQQLAQAQANLNNAQNNWNNLPFTVTGQNSAANTEAGGANSTEGTAAIIMCEAISSPAVLVNQGIDAVFKSLNLGNYNNSNLPSVLSSISSMATQIGSSLILGGIGATPSSAVTINENQVINQGVATAAQVAATGYNAAAQANLAKGVVFAVNPDSSTPNVYDLTWTIITSQLPTASYVTLSGPGIPGATTHLPLSNDSYPVTSPTTGNYILTVFTASGQIVTSVNQASSPPQQSYNFNTNPNAPEVAGAFTQRFVINPRGPALVFSPRGQ
jgi:hypothetical protein